MIVVTGLMRSGTTPLSMMLHRIGVKMGDTMRFPAHGTSQHLEWEDTSLSESLASILLGNASRTPEDVISEYIASRAKESHAWGVKTPFLLPYMDILRKIASDALIPVRFVVTNRDYSDTLESLDRLVDQLPSENREHFRSNLHGIQGLLMSARLAMSGDDVTVFDIKDTWNDPRATAMNLMRIAGVTADIDRVTSEIENRSQRWV